MPTYTSSSFIS